MIGLIFISLYVMKYEFGIKDEKISNNRFVSPPNSKSASNVKKNDKVSLFQMIKNLFISFFFCNFFL